LWFEVETVTLLAVNPLPRNEFRKMQPRFPPDHHFHRRHRKSQGDLAGSTNQPTAAYLIRQCLPAFDASDPRGAA
jgi:hypothetical protein